MIRIVNIVLLGLFVMPIAEAFQLLSIAVWDVDPDTPTLWIKFDEKLVSSEFKKTEFRDKSNPLDGVESSEQMKTILKLVLDDYNGVGSSFLKLAFYPVAGITFPDLDSPTSVSPNAVDSESRVVTISLGSSSSALAAGGEARPEFNDDFTKIIGCNISLSDSNLESAEDFKATLTHEIGHCIGLGHNHNDRESVMSYNRQLSQHALGIDDKMGVTFLYPVDESYANEKVNLGLGCSRSKIVGMRGY